MTGRILVVDDEPDIRMLVRITLDGEGYDVVEASNGEEALEQIAREEPDLVFLDLRMPGIDGWGVLDRLSENGELERIPVVVVSAHASHGSSQRALSLGCRGYISKPFDPDELLQAAERFLSS